MTDVTMKLSAESAAGILDYAKTQDSSLYAEVLRGSDLQVTEEEFSAAVDGFYAPSWRPKSSAILEERIEVMAEKIASSRPQEAAEIFSRAIAPHVEQKTGDDFWQEVDARLAEFKEREGAAHAAQPDMTRVGISDERQKQSIAADLRASMRRAERTEEILSQVAKRAGVVWPAVNLESAPERRNDALKPNAPRVVAAPR